jgi:hypothetical protein
MYIGIRTTGKQINLNLGLLQISFAQLSHAM